MLRIAVDGEVVGSIGYWEISRDGADGLRDRLGDRSSRITGAVLGRRRRRR